MPNPAARQDQPRNSQRQGWVPNTAAAPDERDLGRTFPECFSEVAGRHGDRIAFRFAGSGYTYRELDTQSNRLARRIIDCIGEANEPVAALFEEGLNTPFALVAALKAGKIYVPLDANYPAARLEYMIADTGARLILTDASHADKARSLAGGGRVLVLDDGTDGSDAPLRAPIGPDSTASILYTSGSTGEPKGVVNTHRQILHSAIVIEHLVGMKPGDVMSSFMSFAFAGGMKVHTAALLGGATVVSGRFETIDRLADFFEREKVSAGILSPSMLRQFLASAKKTHRFPDLRVFYIGGEPLRPADVTHFREVFPAGVRLLNVLAMTEVGSVRQFAANEAGELEGEVVPVGYEVGDVEISVLDDELRPVPAGQVGRIAAKSRFVAVGYWRKPEATRETFLEDSDGSGKRTFLTGDMGFCGEDGCLVYLGRRDLQVKVRTFRIEVAEVEAALRKHACVRDASVVAREDKPGDERLVAYIVPADGRMASATDLRRFLAGTLPDYMVPSLFVRMKAFPLNRHGKIDRRALPAPPPSRPELDTPFVEPRMPIERTLAAIWAEALGVDTVGINDDFFDLGGHSLLAARAVSRMNDSFGIDTQVTRLFSNPTVARLAVEVAREVAARSPEDVQRLLDEIEQAPSQDSQSDKES